jgi:hypothetical protein
VDNAPFTTPGSTAGRRARQVWTFSGAGCFNGRVPRGLASTEGPRLGEHPMLKGMMSVANHNIGAA